MIPMMPITIKSKCYYICELIVNKIFSQMVYSCLLGNDDVTSAVFLNDSKNVHLTFKSNVVKVWDVESGNLVDPPQGDM